MTDEQIDARIAELRAKPITKATDRVTRAHLILRRYQLREMKTLSDHIKSIARKKKHFAEYYGPSPSPSATEAE